MAKYKDCVVGSIASYFPFFMIIFFSFGKYTIIGRQLATTGLIFSIYLTYELRLPATEHKDNAAIEWLNTMQDNAWVVKVLGPNVDRWTYS
jgi:hypothetical protein